MDVWKVGWLNLSSERENNDLNDTSIDTLLSCRVVKCMSFMTCIVIMLVIIYDMHCHNACHK